MNVAEGIFTTFALLLVMQEVCCKYLSPHLENGVENPAFDQLAGFERTWSKGKGESSVWNKKDNAVEPPLFIGSFNIQTLNKRKLRNGYLMPTIERIIQRYDMVLILELMTNETQLVEGFLRDVNNFAPDGVQYNMTVSVDPHVQEFCAVFYRTDKLRILKTESYYDPEKFYRKPFFILFDSPTLRDMKQFGLIGYHVKPNQAVREIDALANVYDFMKDKHKIEDIILMGDFNAACDYVKERHWEGISLWTREEFTWAISQKEDTTTNYRSCALDRIVYAGENMNAGVILSSAQAFDYREEFNIPIEEVRAISDHWPIEVKIRGKMSVAAEKHLTSDTCFTVRDSRKPNIAEEKILNASKNSHFTATVLPSGISLSNETKEFDDMVNAISGFRKVLPNAMTREQQEAILFKANNGALGDASSYADEPDAVYKVTVSILKNASEVLVCRATTVN